MPCFEAIMISIESSDLKRKSHRIKGLYGEHRNAVCNYQ